MIILSSLVFEAYSSSEVTPVTEGTLQAFNLITLIILCVFILGVFVLTPVLWCQCRPLGLPLPLHSSVRRRVQKPFSPTVGIENAAFDGMERVQLLLARAKEERNDVGNAIRK